MTDPTAPPPASPRTGAPRRSDRFFAWTAGLGLVRADGWLGGVCAGIAARLRVDPVIIRGVFVVATLFGVPLLVVYAVLWALLPDLEGRIHARDLIRGRIEPVQFGILGLALLGLIPLGPLFVLLTGMPLYYVLSPGVGGWSIASAMVVLFVIGAAIALVLLVFIVRAARRSAAAAPAPATGSGPVAAGPGWGTDAAGFAASSPAPTPVDEQDRVPAAEPALGEQATADEVALWREQHAAWRQREQAWRQEQQQAERAARDHARSERQAEAAAFAAEAAERRRLRKLTKPRTSAAFIGVTVGLAVVTGAVIALVSGDGRGLATGLFAGALVVALAMVVAGLVRRRSGFLAFVTALFLVAGAGTATVVVALDQHAGSYGITNRGQTFPASAPFRQLWWGDLTVTLQDTGSDSEMHVERLSGSTTVYLQPGVDLVLEATMRPGGVYVPGADGEGGMPLDDEQTGVAFTVSPADDGRVTYRTRVSNASAGADPTVVTLVLDQRSGYVQIVRDPDAADTAALDPTPTPAPSEGDSNE